jgi:hypothetical protein
VSTAIETMTAHQKSLKKKTSRLTSPAGKYYGRGRLMHPKSTDLLGLNKVPITLFLSTCKSTQILTSSHCAPTQTLLLITQAKMTMDNTRALY